jgi:hypothetical protein
MAKKVFFSFHYQDVIDFRANVVRNHGNFKLNKDEAGFYDSSIWEEAKKTSDLALKRLINKGIQNTSNTCILVGTHTFKRRWVDYEIMKSFEKGNYIFAVHINQIKCKNQKTKPKGNNPLYYLGYSFDKTGKKLSLHNYIENKWIPFKDLDGWTVKEVFEKDRNTIFRLSTLYPVHDWIEDDGFNQFKNWVK